MSEKDKTIFDILKSTIIIPEENIPSNITFTVKNSTVSEDMTYYAENVCEILEGDPDWDPNLSGKAIYRQNMGKANANETILVEDHEIVIDTSYFGDRRHTIYLYIPFGTDYAYKDNLGTSDFPRKFSQTIEVFPLEECVTFKELKNIPVCKHLIANKNSNDAVLEFYDYPFTILPLENSCSSTDLGHSPKAIGTCPHANRGEFSNCASYEAFEEIELGTLDNKLITLTRTFVGYESVHEYKCEDLKFESFSALQKYAVEKNSNLEITWSPLAKPVPFFETVIGRLEVTYPREKV